MTTPHGSAAARDRLRAALRPRARRVDVAVALLLAVLGFATAVQVRSNRGEGVLASARQEDLVRILDDLSNRDERLRQEIISLTAERERLASGTGRTDAALVDARRRAALLGVLAGTLPAHGPGIELLVTDPRGQVGAEDLLDALEELRDAGAEAVQLGGTTAGGARGAVRVVASTALVDRPSGGIVADGVLLRPPYRFDVIGDPGTLASAMAIPGGVADNIAQRGGTATVTRLPSVAVTALHAAAAPRYARPVRNPTGGG